MSNHVHCHESIGSRIRLVMGETTSNWILILNHPNGDDTPQELLWSDAPDKLVPKLQECLSNDWPIKDLDWVGFRTFYICGVRGKGSSDGYFGYRKDIVSSFKSVNPPTGSLTLGERNGDLSWCYIGAQEHDFNYDNLDPSLVHRLDILSCGKPTTGSIRLVRLFARGAYVLQNSSGVCSWGGPVPDECVQELKRSSTTIQEVAITGNDEWVVIRSNGFVASPGVDPKLLELLQRFYESEKAKTKAARADSVTKKRNDMLESRDKALLLKEQELSHRELSMQKAHKEQQRELEEKEANLKCKDLCLSHKEATLEREAKRVMDQQEKTNELEQSLEMKEADLKSLEDSLKRREAELARREKAQEEKSGEQERATESEKDDHDNYEGLCVICLEDPAERIFSCGHLCLCRACKIPNGRCPMCRKSGSIIQVYGISQSQSQSQQKSSSGSTHHL